jgi:hypothetical protein
VTPTVLDVIAAIMATLATVSVTGLDLRDVGRVGRGRYPYPPAVPFAALSGLGDDSAPGPVLRTYTTTGSLDLVLWGTSPALDLSTRVTTAEAHMDAVRTALLVAHRTPGSALYALPDLVFSGTAVDADFEGASEDCAQSVSTISFRIRRVIP